MGIEETLKRALWGQLGRPSGVVGRIVGRLMTSHNAPAHDLALSHAGLQPNDRVLEVGFGGGALAEKVLLTAPGITVRGIDASEVMVRQANARNAGARGEGRAKLRLGNVSSLPYADESFEKALSVHSIYFWPDPIANLEEVLRVLVPGGPLVVVVDPAEPMHAPTSEKTGHGFWSREALLEILETVGLVEADSGSRKDLGLVCVWGYKQGRV